MIFLFLFLYMLEGQLILFFSLFLDDGGDSAYDGKEELQRLDIFVSGEESIHSKAQSNVVDDIDSEDESDDDVHS